MEILQKIAEKMVARNETIAVAESVTSGHIQALFSLAENTTLFFQGGLTAYNLGQKCRHLRVDPIEAQKTNCVSDKVVQQMSLSVSDHFLSDYGLAITGYAVPIPEKDIHDRFAWVAIAYKGQVIDCSKITSAETDMKKVQEDFAAQAMQKLHRHLTHQQA